jgi:hypothetical protein
MKCSTRSIITLVVILCAAGPAVAASLTAGDYEITGSEKVALRTLISVTPGSEGYSLDDGGALEATFNAPIVDYAFYDASSSSNAVVAGASTEITDALSADEWTTYGGDYTWLWVTTTPNGALDNKDVFNIQKRGLNMTSSINISGLTAGSVYFFYGDNNAKASFDLSMTGSGPDVVLNGQGEAASNGANTQYMFRLDFADAAAYDTITWTYKISTGNKNNTRFSGVVLTAPAAAPPTPGTLIYGK